MRIITHSTWSYFSLLTIFFSIFPPITLAGNLLLFKGSSLQDDTFYGPIDLQAEGVISAAHIQTRAWGVDFDTSDHLAYDLTDKNIYIYDLSLYAGLPDLNETLPLSVGGNSTIREVLAHQPFVTLDTDLRMLVVTDIYYEWNLPADLVAGDINGDGAVDFTDAILVLQLISAIPPSTSLSKQAAIRGDGKISIFDAIHALQTAAGLK